MNCITKETQNQIEVKRSKFIAIAMPYLLFEKRLQEIQKEHPKANHIVWAYRKLNRYNQIVENSSDDGEPKGAAGVPLLKVMQGNNLINSAIVVVRYFGGIKLGVGGMARAYMSAAKSVLQSCELKPFIQEEQFKFSIPYNKQRNVEFIFKKLAITPKRLFLPERIEYEITASKEKIKRIKELLL